MNFFLRFEVNLRHLIDFIALHRRLRFFPSLQGTLSAQFNGKGTRLLCIERNQPIAVYDLNSKEGMTPTTNNNRNNSPNSVSCSNKLLTSGCFVGSDDEFVAAGSSNGRVFIWSTAVHSPGDHQRMATASTELLPLMALRGHSSRVSHVRYNGAVCSLASSSCYDGNIKFWTPFPLPRSLPRSPPDVNEGGDERNHNNNGEGGGGLDDEVYAAGGEGRNGLDMSSSDDDDADSSGEWMFL